MVSIAGFNLFTRSTINTAFVFIDALYLIRVRDVASCGTIFIDENNFSGFHHFLTMWDGSILWSNVGSAVSLMDVCENLHFSTCR